MIAFDNGAFFQYFGTQPDLAVELNEALNATGGSTTLLTSGALLLPAYHIISVTEANPEEWRLLTYLLYDQPSCLFVHSLWFVVVWIQVMVR